MTDEAAASANPALFEEAVAYVRKHYGYTFELLHRVMEAGIDPEAVQMAADSQRHEDYRKLVASGLPLPGANSETRHEPVDPAHNMVED